MRHPSLSLVHALLLALVLLGGQQAAFGHLIGHTGASLATVAQGGDEGHGEALSLSHVCTTCVGLAGLHAAPPPALPLLDAAAGADALPAWHGVPRSAAPFRAYHARAPPSVL